MRYFGVEIEKTFEDAVPSVELVHAGRGFLSFGGEVALGHGADGGGQGWCGIFRGPLQLVGEDDAVHVTAADADDGCATRLALEGDEAEGFLHAGVDEKIGAAVEACELASVALVGEPMDVFVFFAQACEVAAFGAVAGDKQGEARISELGERIKEGGYIFFGRETSDIEEENFVLGDTEGFAHLGIFVRGGCGVEEFGVDAEFAEAGVVHAPVLHEAGEGGGGDDGGGEAVVEFAHVATGHIARDVDGDMAEEFVDGAR